MLLKKRFWLLSLVVGLSLTSGIAVYGQPSDPAMIHVKKGHDLYAKRNLDGAMASYNKAIELSPNLAVAYLHRGHVRREQGELDKAIEDYVKAMELDPRSTQNNRQVAQAFINRGMIKKNNLQVDDALIDLDKAIKVYPAETQAHLERGGARILIEDFDGAIADLSQVIGNEKFDPFRKALAYAARGFARLLLGKEDEAKKDLEESLKLAGKNRAGIDYYLSSLEAQLLMMRQLRGPRQKNKETI